jgi:hypothetical protein
MTKNFDIHVHVFGVAIIDVILTILAGIALWAYMVRKKSYTSLRSIKLLIFILISLFVFAEFCHYVFNVDTAFMKWLKK